MLNCKIQLWIPVTWPSTEWWNVQGRARLTRLGTLIGSTSVIFDASRNASITDREFCSKNMIIPPRVKIHNSKTFYCKKHYASREAVTESIGCQEG